MIDGGSCDFDFQELAEAVCEVQYELGSSVADNFFWESVELLDVVSEQPSDSGCHNIWHCQYGMSMFGQVVHYYHDGIVAMAPW